MIKALGKKVILKSIPIEQKIGGLIIPTDSQERPTKMEVVSVGLSANECLKGGQVVVVPPYGMAEIKVDDVTYYAIDSDQLIAILD